MPLREASSLCVAIFRAAKSGDCGDAVALLPRCSVSYCWSYRKNSERSDSRRTLCQAAGADLASSIRPTEKSETPFSDDQFLNCRSVLNCGELLQKGTSRIVGTGRSPSLFVLTGAQGQKEQGQHDGKKMPCRQPLHRKNTCAGRTPLEICQSLLAVQRRDSLAIIAGGGEGGETRGEQRQ